ncbi:MAG TPA: hypothetical protein VFZ09_44155 [Archangium sp.]|uniref:hypothetical protein n=1 Tax=Archangium sp. TaxID=1872627 RepID=UPI002E31E3EF|nr:hypothetical protein [Archangium sp.]HEX5753276.1 hypothetical protein [Archangium sp.]
MARFTLGGSGLAVEPVAVTPLMPSAPEVGAPWSDFDMARVRRASALGGRPLAQPTPLRWSSGSLHGPVLLGQEDSARVTPALMVATNWWLAYRYRTSYDMTLLHPLFTVGLALNGDLL